jgi:hypothetical protein
MNKKTNIGYKHQPHHTVIYRPSRPYNKDADKLKAIFDNYDGAVSIVSLHRHYDSYPKLIKAARCFRIKQTYHDGEHYWEIDPEPIKGRFKAVSVADQG